MWEPLHRYRTLSADARKLFRRAAVLGPAIGCSLRIRGYSRTRDWLQKRIDRLTVVRFAPEAVAAQVELTCRMVRAAEHYTFFHISCLEESLTLWYLLQRQDIPVAIRIGVRKPEGKFEAHAWVESEGIALNQKDEQHLHYYAFADEVPRLPTERL